MQRAGALRGIKVIDLSRYHSGPRCGMILADMGAEVVRVEDPATDRDGGFAGPTYHGESVYYAVYNRGKKSVELNLRRPRGRQILSELIKVSDVLIENFVPGTMERLGFGYADVRRLNPRVVMVSASGFGQTGPYSDLPAYCNVALAMSGYLYMSGDPNSTVHSSGVSIADRLAAMNGAIGALAALFERGTSGEGQHVDVSLLDSAITMVEFPLLSYLATGVDPTIAASRRAGSAPNRVFNTKDGMIQISASRQKHWEDLAEIIGRADLATDKRVDSPIKRQQPEAIALIEDVVTTWSETQTANSAFSALRERKIPAAPVSRIDEIVENPQVRHREMLPEVKHPVGGYTMRLPGNSIKLSRSVSEVGPAPVRGEHNEEVYCGWLNISPDELEELKDDGVV